MPAPLLKAAHLAEAKQPFCSQDPPWQAKGTVSQLQEGMFCCPRKEATREPSRTLVSAAEKR